MADPESYAISALCYAVRTNRKHHENFIGSAWTDPMHDQDEPIAYYVWVLKNANRTVVVDTGFDKAEWSRRTEASGGIWQCEYDESPAQGLAGMGIDTRQVQDVIVTHLHYDHAGSLDDFPTARFHLQELEMQYATGPHMGHGYLAGAYTVDHVVQMVRNVYRGRVVFHTGDSEIAPGISVHHVGGHTMGMQCVRVMTERGWVVLASDASHFYANFEGHAPFPIVYNAADMLRGFDKLRQLASTGDHIVPGHDPLVMTRYPGTTNPGIGQIVRLDQNPSNH
jgi:glyoxylase-like metal-dependent hydrolase (beta-lactamase superfamily II)